MYATGETTFDMVRERLGERGIKTRNGKLLVRKHITKILTNPIYYGHFRHAGELHEGTHQPIITKKLFDDVQTVLSGRWRWSPKDTTKKRDPKAFTKLLRCGNCGSGITAEVKKGHTYYRCTRKNQTRLCFQPFIREEALDGEISDLLKAFTLRSDWAEDMLKRVKKEKDECAQSAELVAAGKRLEVEKVSQRLQRLLDSLLDGLIDR